MRLVFFKSINYLIFASIFISPQILADEIVAPGGGGATYYGRGGPYQAEGFIGTEPLTYYRAYSTQPYSFTSYYTPPIKSYYYSHPFYKIGNYYKYHYYPDYPYYFYPSLYFSSPYYFDPYVYQTTAAGYNRYPVYNNKPGTYICSRIVVGKGRTCWYQFSPCENHLQHYGYYFYKEQATAAFKQCVAGY